MEHPTTIFATSSSRLCLRVSFSVLLRPSSSCSFMSRSPIPLLHSYHVRHLFSNVDPLVAPRVTSEARPYRTVRKCVAFRPGAGSECSAAASIFWEDGYFPVLVSSPCRVYCFTIVTASYIVSIRHVSQ
jgi:hypothetical protein